jgi:hypothetical protein
MTEKNTGFANNTISNSNYYTDNNDTFLDALLLSSANSSTSAIFTLDPIIAKITGAISKIYPSGTSLASIYADGSVSNITIFEQYNGSKLYGETV